MGIKDFFPSGGWQKWFFIILGQAILLLGVFGIGMQVGLHKGRFLFLRGGQPGTFARPAEGFVPPFGIIGSRGVMPAHGVTGAVVSVNGDTVVVRDPSGQEASVIVDGQTDIRKNEGMANISDITSGSRVVVVGMPDGRGSIRARLLRILPSGDMMFRNNEVFPAPGFNQ